MSIPTQLVISCVPSSKGPGSVCLPSGVFILIALSLPTPPCPSWLPIDSALPSPMANAQAYLTLLGSCLCCTDLHHSFVIDRHLASGTPSLLDFFLSHWEHSSSVSFADLCPTLLLGLGLCLLPSVQSQSLGTSFNPKALNGLICARFPVSCFQLWSPSSIQVHLHACLRDTSTWRCKGHLNLTGKELLLVPSPLAF